MTTRADIDLRERLEDLLQHIRTGRIVEALREFYDPNVTMQDNANPPCIGLEANIARERQFAAGVKAWKGYEVTAIGVGGNVTFYEATVDFVTTDGAPVHLEQVAVAKWKDGKIVQERFYYDTGAGRATPASLERP